MPSFQDAISGSNQVLHVERLHIKEEIQHIAIFHDVFLALGAHLSSLLCSLFALVGNEIVKGNGLCTNEAALKIGMDDASRLRSCRADSYRPCTDFFHARGKVALQSQQLEGGADQAIQSWLFH